MASDDSTVIALTSPQADAVRAALAAWARADLLTPQLADELLATVQVSDPGFDWQRFAKYAFRLAVLCLAVALFSIVADKAFVRLLKRILAWPPALRASLTAAVAVAVHVWAYRRSLQLPSHVYQNEALHGLGALLFALVALQTGEALKIESNNDAHKLNWILLGLAGVYGGVGVLGNSPFIWSCAMIVLGSWFGASTGYVSGWGAYYLDMNYPLRFVLFGTAMVGGAYLMRMADLLAPLWSTTRIWGMLYLFVALWILSIYGNDSLWDQKGHWTRGGNGRLFVWSFAFFAAVVLSTWHGLRYADGTTKGFGLTFIGINLYTKFFEFFWDSWYKPLFFAVLAGSLAAVGTFAERVWNMRLEGGIHL